MIPVTARTRVVIIEWSVAIIPLPPGLQPHVTDDDVRRISVLYTHSAPFSSRMLSQDIHSDHRACPRCLCCFPPLTHLQHQPALRRCLTIFSSAVSPIPWPSTLFTFAIPASWRTLSCSTGGASMPCRLRLSLCQLIWPPSASRCCCAFFLAA